MRLPAQRALARQAGISMVASGSLPLL